MTLRPCTTEDVEDAAHICRLAFWVNELSDVMHPHRSSYPDDFTEHFAGRMRKALSDPSHSVVVTTTSDGRVTGYADWARRDGSSGHDAAKPADEVAVDHDAPVNRAADRAQADVLMRAAPYTAHYWSGDRADTWMLDLIAVHPDFQRHGYGRQLVTYGVDLAKRDSVCASLIASTVGDAFYLRCGFTAVGWATEGEGNPLAGVPGGRIMFIDKVST